MQAGGQLQCVLDVLDAHKAEAIEVLDVREKVAMFDYMVIASGTSVRHQKALAEYLRTDCRQRGLELISIEGLEQGQWVLLDFNAVLVHLMSPQARDFYDLEGLWTP
ncbi:MAG: ribosome silencing factor [Gammaproteobacteria bacterium AqS3]|nr:ribosome silencing factor [Gammaproteobacteria bacterium AqS3]